MQQKAYGSADLENLSVHRSHDSSFAAYPGVGHLP